MESKLFSIIIPCYNEENTIENIVNAVLKIETEHILIEIIIVDDCSQDNSLKIINKLIEQHNNIKVIAHQINRGKGAALRTGFLHANGDFIGIQDADLEYNPQELLILLEPIIDNKADVVYGSRYLKPDTRRVLYFWHTWMNKTLTFISNAFTNLDITDMETCYKVFKRETIKDIAVNLKENRFGFEPEITAHVAQSKSRVYECAISYHPRSIDEGKKISWRDGVHALYCILHYGGYSAPLPMQIIMYFVIGSLSAFTNILTFSILYQLNTELYIANTIAFIIACIVNYKLCISILFKHNIQWKTLKEITIYVLVIFIMGIFDYFIMFSLLKFSFSEITCKFLAATLGFIGNFALRKYFVFNSIKK